MEEDNFEKLLYTELPNLIHRILHIKLTPSQYSKDFLEEYINEIKKITNAECENALSYINSFKQKTTVGEITEVITNSFVNGEKFPTIKRPYKE